ncbi:unnamed protein product [Clonostachys byssicola]|uniref:Uncharacterized protein n=1 Tax=Clonostachys byssicola TaxID=160290 RepID=A0A9N9UPB3_9HYPO|nr:unnamed protein product [Clonostachys byssicola]
MLTPLMILAGYGVVPDQWPAASTFEDLPSVKQEIYRLQEQQRVFKDEEEGYNLGNALDDVPEGLVKWAAANLFDKQRHALESRASFIEAGQARATKLTDLSTELLRMILSNFEYSAPIDGTFEEDIVPGFPVEDRQTVQSLRLVSRLFNTLASPLLCPVVRLQVDEASFNRVRDIKRRPLIASGVRAFSISLEYRPTLLARDLGTWLRNRRQQIDTDVLRLERRRNLSRREDGSNPDPMRQADLLEESTSLDAAWQRARLYTVARRQLLDPLAFLDPPVSREGLAEEDIVRYKELILNSHAAFASAYSHQAQLIWNRSFVRAVARLATKARLPVALEFLERVWNLPTPGRHETRTVFRSEQLLQQFLAADVGWSMSEHAEENDRDRMPFTLIADLPIEIFNWMVKLRGFQLRCPLLPHHVELLRPPKATVRWFGNPFQHLKVLRIPRLNVEHEVDRFREVSNERMLTYAWFFNVLLSAPCLKEVSLGGHPFVSFLLRLGLSRTVLKSLRGIPPPRVRPHLPQLKRVKFSYTAPSRLNMKGLTQNLEDVNLEHFGHGSCTGVDTGKAMNILREGLSRSRNPVSSEEDSPPLFLNIVSEKQRPLADENPALWTELAAYMEGERLNGTPVSMWTITYQ